MMEIQTARHHLLQKSQAPSSLTVSLSRMKATRKKSLHMHVYETSRTTVLDCFAKHLIILLCYICLFSNQQKYKLFLPPLKSCFWTKPNDSWIEPRQKTSKHMNRLRLDNLLNPAGVGLSPEAGPINRLNCGLILRLP